MRRILVGSLVLGLLGVLPASTSGLASVGGNSSGATAKNVCDKSPLRFTEPLRLAGELDGSGRGYEPGIEIDSKDTIFVTAHKLSLAQEEGRLASWLWRSEDKGKTFQDMSGLSGGTEATTALEGDLAVDAKDRLYFVDTWAADNHFYRYSDHGKTLDMYRPGVTTYEVDDRPWLAAHGDGYVYYMSNTGYKHDGRLTVHRSIDGGTTFDPIGFTLPKSGWGFLDADPKSTYVYAFANNYFYGDGEELPLEGAGTKLFIWISENRGETWEQVKVADYKVGYQVTADGHDDAYPQVAVSPVDGSVYTLWTDDGQKLMLGRSTSKGQTWKVYDVTPFEGIFGFPWLSVSEKGDVGVTFLADPKVEPAPTHYVYGMVWRPGSGCLKKAGVAKSRCKGWSATYARLWSETTGNGASQADFFQNEFTKDNAVNVPFTGPNEEIFFVRQTAGPNLTGRSWCGMVGKP